MSELESNPGCLGKLIKILSGDLSVPATGEDVDIDSSADVEKDQPWPYRRKEELLSPAAF